MPRGLPRVLVLTGTSDRPFSRLLAALPALVAPGVAREVRVQSALAVSVPGVVPLGVLGTEAFETEVRLADVVVTHAGSGTCLAALRAGHLPIVVPRRRADGEIVDDHQSDLARELERRGDALVAADPLADSLPRLVSRVAARARGPSRATAPLGPFLRREVGALARGRPRRAAARRGDVSRAEYAAFFRGCPARHPLQSPAWAAARGADGWRPRWWLRRGPDGRALAGAQVLHRRAPWLPGYVAYGPTLADGVPPEEGARLLAAIAAAAPGGLLWGPRAGEAHEPPGAVAVAAPSTTGVLPLDDLDALRARMRGTWRRDLERAERDAAVSVAWDDPERVATDLMPRVAGLARSRGFRAPPPAAVVAAFARDAAADGVTLLAARVVLAGQADPVALGIASVGGEEARTLWLAGDPARAPGGGRLLLFAFLERARSEGATTYDLAGIDFEGNPGVATFKAGLRPDLVEVPGLRWIPPRAAAGRLVGPLVAARLARRCGGPA